MADNNGNVENLTIMEIVDRLEELKDYLDTIIRTASELTLGIDARLQELQAEKEISRPLDKHRSMQAVLAKDSANKEVQLLYGSSDRYGIYQLKDNPELDRLRFEGTDSLTKRGIANDNLDVIAPENYDLVYAGELSDIQGNTKSEKLGDVF